MATPSAGARPQGPSNAATIHTTRLKRVLGVLLAIAAGLVMAAQSRVNGQLGREVRDSAFAAVLSFGGGLLILAVLLGLSPRMRSGLAAVVSALRDGKLRPWHCLGGVAGALYVLAQSVTVAVVGVALFTVGVVAGQTVSGLFVDKVGIGPAGRKPLSWPRVLGALLTVAAVGIAVAGRADAASPGELWLLVLPVLVGAGVAVQQAINGHVSVAAGSPLTAALVNFSTGFAVLVGAWLISLATRGLPGPMPSNPALYLGGLFGLVFIAVSALVVGWIGVLLLALASVAGQLVGSVLLDAFLPTVAGGITAPTLIGCVVAMLALLIAGMGRQRRGLPRPLKQSDS